MVRLWRRQEKCVWAGEAGARPDIGVTSGMVRCSVGIEAGTTEDGHCELVTG